MTREIPWLRVFVEGVVIVGSILLAFGLQAWWEGRQEAADERDSLQLLRVEVEANLAQLREKRGNHEGARRAAQALLEVTGPTSAPQVSADSVGRLIWDVSTAWSFDPADGVLSSLVSSGRLRIIQNDSLRTELAGWPSLVADLREDEAASWRIIDTRVTPFLDTQIAWRTVAHVGDPAWTAGSSDFGDDLLAVLRNREFENLMAGRLWYANGILRDYEPAERSLERTLRLIDEELRPGG